VLDQTVVLIVIFSLLVIVGVFFWASAIAAQAENKGRSFTAFFWLSFLLSPILMHIIVASLSDSPAPAAAPAAAGTNNESATKKLADLKSLLDSGAITQDEFDEKKKKLLEQI